MATLIATGTGRGLLVVGLLVFVSPAGCDEGSPGASPEQASRAMFKLSDIALDEFEKFRKKGVSSSEALQMMLTMLRGQKGIRAVRFSKAGRTVTMEHNTGRLHHILLDSHSRLTGTGKTTPSGLPPAGGTMKLAMAVHPKGKQAKLLYPFEWQFENKTAAHFEKLLKDAGFSTHGIEIKYNNKVRPRDFLTGGLSFLYLDTHGMVSKTDDGVESVILATGVDANKQSPEVSAYMESLGLTTATTSAKKVWIAVTPAYIEGSDGVMDNAQVYADACHSAENETLARAYFKRGAAAYFGWVDSVLNSWATVNVKKVIPKLLQGGTSAKEAYAAVDKEWPKTFEANCSKVYTFCDKYNPDFKLLQKNNADDVYLLPEDGGVTPMDAGTPVDSAPDIPPVQPGTWRTIKAGTFVMGSPTTELCRGGDEEQHQVKLTHGFKILATEVTQGEFKAAMGYNPAYFPSCGSTCPVENVSWHQAVAYANALSKKAGLKACYTCTGINTSVSCLVASAYDGGKIYKCPGYRLPTEAEWEYAYRAGTKTPFYNGKITQCYHSKDSVLDKIGWYSCNAMVSYAGCYNPNSWCGSKCMGTLPVGRKQPNDWGLYDMAGNVGEWCHDWYDGYPSSSVTDPWGPSKDWTRVVRGGSWRSGVREARAADRQDGNNPKYPDEKIGFRLVQSIQ